MIINFPTGLYSSILPHKPEAAGNVTYTISNNTPPRTNLLFPKVSRGITNKKLPPKITDIFVRRNTQGDLIFSVSSANRSNSGNTSNLYKIGEVLEFGDLPTQIINPMYVASKSETRHDIDKFDYDSLDLTTAEVNTIGQQALLAQEDLTVRLNAARTHRANAEVDITTQQKTINDINRNIKALEVIASNSDDVGIDELVQRLVEKRNAAFVIRDAAKTRANEYAIEASALQDQLRVVATVVK